MEINEEAIKYLEAQIEPSHKEIKLEKCNYCFQRFSQASFKFIHQREVHGKMDGWLK